jgi:hypothetical protein
MKTSLISSIGIIKVSLLGITFLAFSACSKESIRKCEKWEVEDIGYIKEGCWIDLGCGRRTLRLGFCGDDLNDAKAGNTITTYETDCCKTTRTFIRKVQ